MSDSTDETEVLRARPGGFTIQPIGPFSWAQAVDGLMHWAPVSRFAEGSTDPVRLAFPLDRSFVPVAVALRERDGSLEGEVAGSDDVLAAGRQVARMFGLDQDATGLAAAGDRDPALKPVLEALAGLRQVCFSSPYEAAAWGIISQRISKRQAAAIQARLIAAQGHRLEVAGGEVWSFPSPERLLEVTEVPGLAGVKVERLHGVARAALSGLLDAESLLAMGEEAAVASLRRIPGIGEFWASGIYLRGCAAVDSFPDEPLSIAALGVLHGLGEQPDPAEVRRLTDLYRPYRMWVCYLLRVAAARGIIPGISGREMAIRRAPRTGPPRTDPGAGGLPGLGPL